jgi:uncharacterized protein
MSGRMVVDSMKFAREAGEIADSMEVANLSRLRDELFEPLGAVVFKVEGLPQLRGKPALRVKVAADLVLKCQRCLGPVKFRVDSTRQLELVPATAALVDLAEEPDDIEQIHADPALDVVMLIEDELLLGLPMVVAHPQGACSLPVPEGMESRQKSPFEALSKFKQ